MLKLFETLADRYNEKDKHLSWKSPITGFPVIQNYMQPINNRTKLRYGDNEFHVVVENWEESTLDKESQRLGASPNLVHSLDAVHMALTIEQASFDIMAIHDSFGCVPGNTEKLFCLVRETFVELYKQDPLMKILEQLDSVDLLPTRGKLDIEKVKASDFAFV